jgi:hypothetical protein
LSQQITIQSVTVLDNKTTYPLQSKRIKIHIDIPEGYTQIKDPCPVFDGRKWHIFGTAQKKIEAFWTFHATAANLEGPWKLEEPIKMERLHIPADVPNVGVCAPGVVYNEESEVFHLFTQTHFDQLGGAINHLISRDGQVFQTTGLVIESKPGTKQAGVYDPHPAVINGKKYIVYSGYPKPGHGDLYLLESESDSWHGPWIEQGIILCHEDIHWHHNQHDQHDYEWGIEGAQLIQLPSGKVLLNAVCFLPDVTLPRSKRQRIFFAIADNVYGPYRSLGPVLDPGDNHWESGENGHAAGVVIDKELKLVYQARAPHAENWSYGIATFAIADIEKAAEEQIWFESPQLVKTR